jgi:hypothetical protein
MRFSIILTALAAAATAYADCSSLGPGATSTVSGRFNLAAYNVASGTTTALHILQAVTIPYTSYHIVGVCFLFYLPDTSGFESSLTLTVTFLQTASSPAFIWLGLTMSGGVITTIPPDEDRAPAYTLGNLSPNNGYPPNPPGPFVTFANTGTPSSAFCVVVSASSPDFVFCARKLIEISTGCV